MEEKEGNEREGVKKLCREEVERRVSRTEGNGEEEEVEEKEGRGMRGKGWRSCVGRRSKGGASRTGLSNLFTDCTNFRIWQ